MRRVRRISFGITTRPKSSILLTIPVAFIWLFLPCQNWRYPRRLLASAGNFTLLVFARQVILCQNPFLAQTKAGHFFRRKNGLLSQSNSYAKIMGATTPASTTEATLTVVTPAMSILGST